MTTSILGLLASLLLLAGAPRSVEAAALWSTHQHPCPGLARTDALHRDADGTLWVGCGTNQDGRGLYVSFDGGPSWASVTTAPADVLSEFRVNSIVRGHDGALYVGGVDTRIGSGNRVMRVDTTGSMPFPTTATLIATPQVGRQFTVGNYAELSDGRSLAESLTGFDKLFRPSADTPPQASNWTIPSASLDQFTQMIVHNDGFYAAGSRINVPPKVFLPPRTPGAQPWDLVEVILDRNFDGEMWGIAANEKRVVAVGVNQDSNVGMIFVSSDDPYSAENYRSHRLPDIIGTGGIGTWARGVCMRDDWIVVVGERQPLSSATGRVMASSDGGESFTNITPAAPPETVSRCVIAADGRVTVAGAAGFIGVWTGFVPPDEIFRSRFQPGN
ncbi:MAG: hypothetical protein ACXIUM_01435 [Wenzhouxiangella sp.]